MTSNEHDEQPDQGQQGRSVQQLDHPVGVTVLDQLARTVAERPGTNALVDVGRTFTYEALNEVVETVARGLVTFGVQPGDRVAVALACRADAVLLILGTLRAGAVAVPVDVACPDDRTTQILLDADARLLVTDDERAPALLALLADQQTPGPDRTWHVCCAGDVVGAVGDHLPSLPSPDDVAYLVYTSGTTGTPTGVEVPHSALVTVLAQHEAMIGGPARARTTTSDEAPLPLTLLVSGLGLDSQAQRASHPTRSSVTSSPSSATSSLIAPRPSR
ncbi:AMP-binding protein [Sanguibacter sp. 25GB23B1]|uniref:AMP-binding protein n=1 Tax=unclassified Sanguibacter TaxID=2645534 RepID=UPI0032AF3042